MYLTPLHPPFIKGGRGGVVEKRGLHRGEDIKKREKGYEGRKSVLDGVPKELPSLLMAHRLQDKAARVGFDWEHIDQVFAKVEEEMDEFRRAFSDKNTEEMENELGDLLFALVNIARFIEEEIARQCRELKNVSLEEMDKLWNEAKEK